MNVINVLFVVLYLLSTFYREGLVVGLEYKCKYDDEASEDVWEHTTETHNTKCSKRNTVREETSQSTNPALEVISRFPAIYLYRHCITDTQRKQLLGLAAQRLTQETNSGFSSSLYLNKEEDSKKEILRNIVQRAGNLSGTSWKHAEPVSLTKYTVNQQYGLHFDSGFTMKGKPMKRIATYLVYLNDVEKGGETIFPYATNHSQTAEMKDIEKPLLKDVCSQDSVIKVAAQASSCLIFWNHHKEDADVDPLSLHGSCPVVAGEKWIAQIWLHHEPWGQGVTDFWQD